MKIRLTCTVNGEPVDVLVEDYKTLLEVLREDLVLTGTKHGCELGECGACAVLVDGQPLLSCLLLAIESEGRYIETVEGLSGDGRRSQVRSRREDRRERAEGKPRRSLIASERHDFSPGIRLALQHVRRHDPLQRDPGKRRAAVE